MIEDALRGLLAAPPGEFVAARAEAVRALKARGEAAAARELAAVRKPALRLWAANRAAAGSPDAAERLASATAELREAERRVAGGGKGLGSTLREAAAEQRRQLDVLEAEARRVLEEAGAATGAAAEARAILRSAVLAGGDSWARLAGGVLLDEPSAGEVFALGEADLPKRAAASRDRSERHRQQEARAAAREARAQAIELDRVARDLEEQARQARRRAEAAAAKAEAAERALSF